MPAAHGQHVGRANAAAHQSRMPFPGDRRIKRGSAPAEAARAQDPPSRAGSVRSGWPPSRCPAMMRERTGTKTAFPMAVGERSGGPTAVVAAVCPVHGPVRAALQVFKPRGKFPTTRSPLRNVMSRPVVSQKGGGGYPTARRNTARPLRDRLHADPRPLDVRDRLRRYLISARCGPSKGARIQVIAMLP